MMGSPDVAARSRYNSNFKSSIFEPLPTPQGSAYVPAGKRRDQSTAEIFGTFDEKNLRGMPKTFVPKDDYTSASQKKLQHLSSDVLPRTAHAPRAAVEQEQQQRRPQGPWMEEEEEIDANLRRQMELQSTLFGRATPEANLTQLHDRSMRLAPNDFNWHSHPEALGRSSQDMTHEDRAFQEKCSHVFDHRSPQNLQNHLDARRQEHVLDREGDMKRRGDAQYSDLFGRSAHTGTAEQGERRAKHQGTDEDKLIVHQDWTDSKTEMLGRGNRPEHPLLRKSDELHQARIFGPRGEAWSASTDRPASVTHDNSFKVKSALGSTTQQIHQAHLRSSAIDDGFYAQAESNMHWEVVELHIFGLGIHADDEYVRNLCMGFDLQIVKVVAEVDPVSNLCKGRAKVMVRYNPKRESIGGLVSKLEASRLRVDM